MTPEAGMADARSVGWRQRLPWWLPVVAVGSVAAVVFGAPTARDLIVTRDLPVEHAVVTAVEENTGFFDGCGKRETAATITWHSSDPPPGKPATFTDPDSCDGDVVVGERCRIARADDGTVYVDPPTSWAQVAAMTTLGAATGGGAMMIALGIQALMRTRRMQRFRPPWRRGGDLDAFGREPEGR